MPKGELSFQLTLVLWNGKQVNLTAYKTRRLLREIWVPFMENMIGTWRSNPRLAPK
jgi:hypothetical protein